MLDGALLFNGKRQTPVLVVLVLVLRLPGPLAVLKLPKALPVLVTVLRLVLVLPELKSVPVSGLGVDVDDGSMIVEMRPVEDGSAVVVSPIGVPVLSGAPVLVFTDVDGGAGTVRDGRPWTFKFEHICSSSKKENT